MSLSDLAWYYRAVFRSSDVKNCIDADYVVVAQFFDVTEVFVWHGWYGGNLYSIKWLAIKNEAYSSRLKCIAAWIYCVRLHVFAKGDEHENVFPPDKSVSFDRKVLFSADCFIAKDKEITNFNVEDESSLYAVLTIITASEHSAL